MSLTKGFILGLHNVETYSTKRFSSSENNKYICEKYYKKLDKKYERNKNF